MARRRASSGPKLDATDFEVLSSTDVPTPNKRSAPKNITDPDADSYLRNPMLKKTSRLSCEADLTGHDATHFFTPQGGDEVALCKNHLDTAVTKGILMNKTIKQRPITRDDVEAHALKRRLEMFEQRRIAEEGLRARGLTGEDALSGRKKIQVGGGRAPHRDPEAAPPSSGKEIAASARQGVHPAEELLSAVEESGGHNVNVLRDLNILNAEKNKVEQPHMYDQTGNRIYELSNKGRTKPLPTPSEKTFEELRAENHAKRSEAAKKAKNTGRFRPGSNVNPGRGGVIIVPNTGPKEDTDVLGKAFEKKQVLDDVRATAGIESSTEAERLRHIERLKTDPAYRKQAEIEARKAAKNKSAPPFTT